MVDKSQPLRSLCPNGFLIIQIDLIFGAGGKPVAYIFQGDTSSFCMDVVSACRL